ncbi:MAG: hypothetical protein FJ271_06780 [Planctomycetes bacterium]|nr:hypothetical protein [Planctomycetota bacterium]
MQLAQVLIYEKDGRLAESLRALSESRGIWVRELRQARACLDALARGGIGVLVLKIGRDLERELTLLQQAAWNFPDCRTVVVGDVDHPALADLAWDLGAAFVFMPPTPFNLLPEVVDRLLKSGLPHIAAPAHGDPQASATGVRG